MVKRVLDQKRLRETFFFLVKLNLFAIPLYLILLLGIEITPLQAAVKNIVFYLLDALHFSPTLNDYFISIPIKNGNWGAFINWDCTGWKSMFAFFALVMATSSNTRKKIQGLVLFIPLIFVVNIIRIVFMFYFVKTLDLAYFAVVHAFIWSWGLIFTIIIFWIIWVKYIPAGAEKKRMPRDRKRRRKRA